MANPEDKHSRRVLTRTISFVEDGEPAKDDDPSLHKFNTVTPSLLAKWRSLRRNVSFLKEDEEEVSVENGHVDDLIFVESMEGPEFEEDLNITVCKDLIRQGLVDLMKSGPGNAQLLYDLEIEGRITPANVDEVFKGSTLFERNVAFLMACFLKRKDLTAFFLKANIDVNFYDPRQGFGALHLSGFSGCVDCTGYLISQGADVNLLLGSYTPLHCAAFGNSPLTAKMLIKAGAKAATVGAGSERLGSNETVLHSAVRAKALECIQLFIDEHLDVNFMAGSGSSPLHLAADFGYTHCLRLLLKSKRCDVNLQTSQRQNTPLHLAAEGGFVECVELLLAHGANPNVENSRKQTPLHLAAKVCHDCVDVLLRNGADPNARDSDRRTPLHAAVCKSGFGFSLNIINSLHEWKANVNMADVYGYTPLHIAALNELTECAEKLILLGADVTAKTRGGSTALSIVSRKIPWVLPVLSRVLDECITIGDKHISSKSVALKFNFKYLLHNCGNHETSLLQSFIASGEKRLLEHPLCEAFLHLKWKKFRKFYIGRLTFCFLFVVLLSLYVLTALAYECYNDSLIPPFIALRGLSNTTQLCDPESTLGQLLRTYPDIIRTQWFVLALMSLIEMVRKLFGTCGYRSFKEYVLAVHNITEWFVILSVFLVSFIYDGQTHTWQNHVGALAVLCGWFNFMVMIGYLPAFGSYVLMFTTVLKEFLKLFIAFFCLLLGFTICFCVMFPRGEEFANPLVGFVKIIVMMSGELDFKDLMESVQAEGSTLLQISALVALVLFVVLVSIILMNLLIGIAVHDIQGLRKTAKLEKLVSRTHLIARIERALYDGMAPTCCFKFLRLTSAVFPSGYGVVVTVRPLNPRETRLPKDVMREGLRIAKGRKFACKSDTKSLISGRHGAGDQDKDISTGRFEEVYSLLLKLTAEMERLKEVVKDGQDQQGFGKTSKL